MTESEGRQLQMVDDVIWDGNILDRGSIQGTSRTHVFIRWENKDRHSGWYRYGDLGGIHKVSPVDRAPQQ